MTVILIAAMVCDRYLQSESISTEFVYTRTAVTDNREALVSWSVVIEPVQSPWSAVQSACTGLIKCLNTAIAPGERFESEQSMG